MTSRFPPFAFVELVSPYNKKNITRWLEDMNFMVLVPVGRRNKYTLLPIIQAHILLGTLVMREIWKAYDCLKDEGCNHLTVDNTPNKSVDPDTWIMESHRSSIVSAIV